MAKLDRAAGVVIPRRLLGLLPTIVFTLVTVVSAFYLWPTNLGGCTTLTIVSGHSMEPTYYTGDLVVSRCGQPRVGDVIVYQPDGFGGARVIHRVVGGDAGSGWAMRGDNNDTGDPWGPSGAEVLGIATLHLPYLGAFAMLLLSPVLWVSLVILAAGLLIWPTSTDDVDLENTDQNDAVVELETAVVAP